MSSHSGHVKFSDGTHLEQEGIHVDPGSPYQLPEAHIGMLKNHHTYHADFCVCHTLGTDVTVSEPNYNLYVRTIEHGESTPDTEQGEGKFKVQVKIQIKTIKEGRIREKLILSSSDDKNKMEVLVTAQVMGTNQGNPLLKDGVHMISHEIEDESEWPGHSSH